MRRGRKIREHRSELLTRKKVISLAERRRLARAKALKSKRKRKTVIMGIPESEMYSPSPSPLEVARTIQRNRNSTSVRRRAALLKAPRDSHRLTAAQVKSLPSNKPSSIKSFKSFDQYECGSKTIVICHVIESLGLGGAQTMMMELVNALNTYYGENSQNIFACVHRKKQSGNKLFYRSYGIKPIWVAPGSFKTFLEDHKVDVVLHHRISLSRSLRGHMPPDMKYIILNHTWHSLTKMRDFLDCDYYVSVCDFLKKHTSWREFIHPSRNLVILNGVENNYIDQIPMADLPDGIKTGRCHRLVPTKFKVDYLAWMHKRIAKRYKGFSHHILGTFKKLTALEPKYKWLHCYGTVTNREKKMSIIKALDMYYYETFQDEGASIAILESLACGVPVLAKPLGGTPELIRHGKNGFICNNREEFGHWIGNMISNPKLLKETKRRTLIDFDERLHVRHAACKYMQLFESLL